MLSRLACVAERTIEDQVGGGALFELVANFDVSDARRVTGLVRNVKNRNISIAVAQTGALRGLYCSGSRNSSDRLQLQECQ